MVSGCCNKKQVQKVRNVVIVIFPDVQKVPMIYLAARVKDIYTIKIILIHIQKPNMYRVQPIYKKAMFFALYYL